MASNEAFTNVKIEKQKRNVFDLSHEVKLSFNMGELIPFMCQEVLPDDKFIVDAEVLARFQPMLAPLMHRVDVYTHFFFVPNRIIWEDWEEFITGGEDGLSAPSIPTLTLNNANKAHFEKGKLADYLGIPIYDGVTAWAQDYEISQLPFRAYHEIFNEYYRDQNLTGITNDWSSYTYASWVTVRKRCWEKDYFTSALPWTQRGAEVELPLGSSAPVVMNSAVRGARVYLSSGGAPPTGDINNLNEFMMSDNGSTNVAVKIDPNDTMDVDLTSATGATLNELRRATKLQEWLEGMARGGSRYSEQLKHMFGVTSSDARLQRPEYLGGGRAPMVISEVLQTSEESTTPLGQMAGHGVSVGKSNEFVKYFEEHGHVIGIITIMPRTAYTQGINKMFLRTTKEEYYWPQFAQLGEQAIEMQELYADYYNVNDIDETFGYQSRYAEYKYNQDRVSGDFRDDFDYWHLAREFSARPALNSTFVKCEPSHRIFAVVDPDEDKVFCQIYNKIKAVRPIPYFNVPTL